MCMANNLPPEELELGDNNLEMGLHDDIVNQELPANRINHELIAGRRAQMNIIRNHFTTWTQSQ